MEYTVIMGSLPDSVGLPLIVDLGVRGVGLRCERPGECHKAVEGKGINCSGLVIARGVAQYQVECLAEERGNG